MIFFLSAAYRKLEWPISPDGTLIIILLWANLLCLKSSLGFLLTRAENLAQNDAASRTHAAMILSPTQLEHLIIPNIVHSTFLRFDSFLLITNWALPRLHNSVGTSRPRPKAGHLS